MMQIN